MKILIAASEVAPIIKLGGLGDVIGALPKALEKIGVNADVIVPYFPIAKVENVKLYKGIELEVPFDNGNHVVSVFKTKLPDSDVDVILLKNADYFAGGGVDAFAGSIKETEMFSFFDRCVVEYIKAKFNTYDLVHCNDWHTGLVTHLLQEEIGATRPATLITIHNLSYQGVGDLHLVEEVGFVPGTHKSVDVDIEDGDINLLQQAVMSSDFINTVSKTYAKEILYKDLGGELSSILQGRQGRLKGILNGIDYTQFDRPYNEKSWQSEKLLFKKKIKEELNLASGDQALYCYIGRLDPNQKGLDILVEAIPDMIKNDSQFILLGTGDPLWEGKLKKLADKTDYKDNLSINIMFDVDLAERIYAGSDFILVPSRFEPCGLIQMIAMYYGTLPVVHATGGLKDTVVEGENGFLFNIYSSKDLLKAFSNSLGVYYKPELRKKMVENAMAADFSWDKSAVEYKKLYEEVIHLRKRALELVKEDITQIR